MALKAKIKPLKGFLSHGLTWYYIDHTLSQGASLDHQVASIGGAESKSYF